VIKVSCGFEGYLCRCAQLVGPPPRRRAWYPPCTGGSVATTLGVLGFSEGAMGAPAYWGCPLWDAPFSCRSATERDYGVLHKDHPSGVYAWLIPVLQYRYGAGLATSSPLRGTAARPSSCPYSPECVEGKFSEVRLYRVLRISPRRGSKKFEGRELTGAGSMVFVVHIRGVGRGPGVRADAGERSWTWAVWVTST
jgi:hypothetical protein